MKKEKTYSLETYFNLKYYLKTVLSIKLDIITHEVIQGAYYIDFITDDGFPGLVLPIRKNTGEIEKYLIAVEEKIIGNVDVLEFEIIKPLSVNLETGDYLHQTKIVRKKIMTKNKNSIFIKLAKRFIDRICFDSVADKNFECFNHLTLNNYFSRFIFSKN